MTAVEVFAPAKVNLTLHVTGQRADGYHLLDSLVVFADVGDRLTLATASAPDFVVTGPFADAVPAGPDNLVLRAAALLAPDLPLAITLEKALPPSSGIGGGSADAAAVARGVAALTGAAPDPAALLSLGADVPMCLDPRPLRVRGIGERLDAVTRLPALSAVLANPLKPMPTQPVFRALERKDNPPMPDRMPAFADAADLIGWLSAERNDLQDPAMALLPEIGAVLSALAVCKGARLTRMSGSGATCLALFATDLDAAEAAAALSASHPGWWVRAATLGDATDAARPVDIGPTA
jgi:4-diphosphocytidyl-2-C-methyl-D-erythritol kinase